MNGKGWLICWGPITLYSVYVCMYVCMCVGVGDGGVTIYTLILIDAPSMLAEHNREA